MPAVNNTWEDMSVAAGLEDHAVAELGHNPQRPNNKHFQSHGGALSLEECPGVLPDSTEMAPTKKKMLDKRQEQPSYCAVALSVPVTSRVNPGNQDKGSPGLRLPGCHPLSVYSCCIMISITTTARVI